MNEKDHWPKQCVVTWFDYNLFYYIYIIIIFKFRSKNKTNIRFIFKLSQKFTKQIEEGNIIEREGSYERLKNFVLERAYLKKAIMTIPYNVSAINMKKYIISDLYLVEHLSKDGIYWYSKSEKLTGPYINNKDVFLLVSCIQEIISKDFVKIKKLMKYLRNIATILTLIGLPIIWTLPHGLTVRQSYLEVKSTSIRPFIYSKAKINIQVVNKEKYDKSKQIRALMPNLIHSLDASSLSLLYDKFNYIFDQPQFLAILDCFGTTLDKVFLLKTLLASVYMDIYSNDPYLDKFDANILDYIEQTGKIIDKEKRLVEINVDNGVKQYELHNIKWVKNEETVNKSIIKRIDSQYILL